MLLRHSAIYLIARGLPGLIGFATIIIFTRILSPQAYGQYALVVTGAVLCNAILYQWLNASLLRFLPEFQDHEADLLAAILRGYLIVSLLTVGAGAVLAIRWWGSNWGELIAIGTLLTCVQAWFAINLELARSRLSPVRYGVISTFKAVIAMGVGTAFVLRGFGAFGALLGLVLGFSAAALWSSRGEWVYLRRYQLDRNLVRRLLNYGLPLTVSFALGTIISSSDRFMLAWLIDESATGLYAAGQALVQQAIIALMTMVHLAAYPLILRTLDREGIDAAQVQLRKNAILLFGIGLPACTGFVVLAPNIAYIFIGEEFQAAAAELMPWLAIATLLWCARAYYFDLAFYLGRRTPSHMIIMSMSALLNVVLNYWFIPIFGLLGAVYASVSAHGIAILLSGFIGRRAFKLPRIGADLTRLIVATLMMAVPLVVISDDQNVLRLILSIAVSGCVYLGMLYALDLADLRKSVSRILSLTRISSTKSGHGD